MELVDRTHTICLSCSADLFPFSQSLNDDDLMSCINDEPNGPPIDVNDKCYFINSNDKFLKLYEDIHENRPLLQNGNLDPDEHYFTNHQNTCRYATLSDLNTKSVPGQFVFMQYKLSKYIQQNFRHPAFVNAFKMLMY